MERISVVLVLVVLALEFAPPLAADVDTSGYIGSQKCAECHETEYRLWRGSHHDPAMAEATEETVLGDFDNATFTAHGVTSAFYSIQPSYL